MRAYTSCQTHAAKKWFQDLDLEKDPPTEEQKKFLLRVIDRCLQEKHELEGVAARQNQEFQKAKGRRAKSRKTSGMKPGPNLDLEKERECSGKSPKASLSEPIRDCVFGIPGAGKSTCIKLLRRFFIEVMHWESGVQFQTLASQNTMAALVGCATVHRWGTIPICAEKAAEKMQGRGKKDADMDALFISCTGMRWLIVDEASTLSPSLLGILDAYLRNACTSFPYACRNGKGRPFGGINIIFAGDLWQLPPVQANSFFNNPYIRTSNHGEQKILEMFWKKGDDSIQSTWLLTKSMRTDDEWLQTVLDMARHGTMSWEVYCFIHGLCTRHCGSWLPNKALPACGQQACADLADGAWSDMLQYDRLESNWEERQSLECQRCQKERQRRCWIIQNSTINQKRYIEEPFVDAPYVHPFRQPSFHAQQLRAMNFAKTRGRRVLWMKAVDKLCREEKRAQTEKEALREEKWLTYHDRYTSGVPGLFPLILDLPVRFTEPPHDAYNYGIFKNTQGIIRGWRLSDTDSEHINEETLMRDMRSFSRSFRCEFMWKWRVATLSCLSSTRRKSTQSKWFAKCGL